MKQFALALVLTGGLALVGGIPAYAASDTAMQHGSAMSHDTMAHGKMSHGMKHHSAMKHDGMSHGGKADQK